MYPACLLKEVEGHAPSYLPDFIASHSWPHQGERLAALYCRQDHHGQNHHPEGTGIQVHLFSPLWKNLQLGSSISLSAVFRAGPRGTLRPPQGDQGNVFWLCRANLKMKNVHFAEDTDPEAEEHCVG